MTAISSNAHLHSHPITPKIVVWSKTGCHFCQEIKTYLEVGGYSYINLEVAGNDNLRDVLEAKYGIRHVPVVEIGHGGSYTALLEPDLEKLQYLLEQQQQTSQVSS